MLADEAGVGAAVLADQHVVQHRQLAEEADVLEGPGHARGR